MFWKLLFSRKTTEILFSKLSGTLGCPLRCEHLIQQSGRDPDNIEFLFEIIDHILPQFPQCGIFCFNDQPFGGVQHKTDGLEAVITETEAANGKND